MKTCFVGIIACILMPLSSFAKDSVWGLANNDKIALSFLEHRFADDRAAEVKLITGDWLLTGLVKDHDGYTKPAPITLTGPKATFKGTISIDFSTSKVALKGKLTLDGTPFDLNETMAFKELEGL